MSASIIDSWSRIEKWLKENAPSALEEVAEPATQEAIDSAVKTMNVQFHTDHIELCQIFNGAESSGIFPACDEWEDMAFSPMSLDETVSAWEMLKDLLEMGEFADLTPQSCPGVAEVWWHTSWIPIADNGGGDYYCIDLDPADGGVVGQFIFHSHESGEHVVLADSLGSYLNELADKIEAGELEYDEDDGLKAPEED